MKKRKKLPINLNVIAGFIFIMGMIIYGIYAINNVIDGNILDFAYPIKTGMIMITFGISGYILLLTGGYYEWANNR